MDPVGVVGLLIGLLGVGFGVDQFRRGRKVADSLDRIEKYMRERDPAGAEDAQERVTADVLVQWQESDQALREAVADAIARLPEPEKIAVTLHYYEGLSERETADVLGVSLAEVEEALTRAVLRLRNWIAHRPEA